MSSDSFMEYAKERVSGGNAYAFAFGMVWTSLTEAQQKDLIQYAEKKLAEIKAERGEN